ncbi:MAG: SAM-dependent methyltransferase [Nocardioidaceae bacterium]
MTDPTGSWPTWRDAWTAALYGPDGFFVRSRPADHFRTSVHASVLFADAVHELARRADLRRVVDLGAGGGELLRHLNSADQDLHLVGVDLAPRPDDLPAAVDWRADLPEQVDGLVIANEWLDNIPCDVVEADQDGVARTVHVEPSTGAERLGAPCTDPWLGRWWSLSEPGTRAEVGSSRDAAWSDVVGRLGRGVAVAMDYGHTRATRPAFGSLTSYQHGREVPAVPDASRDVTAHVAVDSLPADRVLDQRQALGLLGISGQRPPLDRAHDDPRGYLRALSAATEAAELTARGGLGDFVWVVCARGVPLPL